MTLLSIVIPCFNEEAVIMQTHERLTMALSIDPQIEIEILYINDGCSDNTKTILENIASLDTRVKVISFTRNFGHQAAVTAGLEYAEGDIVVITDADLQDPPEVIPHMVAKWREGFDVVYGVRTKRKENWVKRLAYKSFYRIYRKLANVAAPVDSGDFALLDRRVVNIINKLPEKNRFIRGLRSWAGTRQTGFVYERAVRAAGESKYSFSKLVKLAFDGIFNFSTVPLSLIFILGLTTAIGAVISGSVYLMARLWDFSILGRSPEDVPGFTTLILSILFFSGVQLISIGILGEYIGRIYQETKNRPTYVVEEIKGTVASGKAPADSVGLLVKN